MLLLTPKGESRKNTPRQETISVPLTFSFAQLAKGKSLGRSKPATNSQAQALATHCVEYSTISKSYRTAFYWALQDVSELGYLFHDSPVCI